MKLLITPRARQQVERAGRWWEENREKAPGLFAEELADAEQHLVSAPESGEPWRIRRRQTIRRWLVPKTGYHLYYVLNPPGDRVVVLALWGARRARDPKL